VDVVGGRVLLSSVTTGAEAELRVIPEPASVVTLGGAPEGRISPVLEAGQTRVFYEAWETPTQADSLTSSANDSASPDAGKSVLRRIYYKTFLDDSWRDSHPVFPQRVVPQADPAVVAIAGGPLFLAWVDNPQTATSEIRFAFGSSRPLLPARIQGQRKEPFELTAGGKLTLIGDWAGADTYTVNAADFASIGAATAAEVAAAMTAQLTKATAVAQPGGSVQIQTRAGGPAARVGVDLAKSTTARILGLENPNTAVPGSWSEEMDWSDPMDPVSIAPGRHAELAAQVHPGGIRIIWACHRRGLWRITHTRQADQMFAGTANGLFMRAGAGAWTAVAGLPSTDVRDIATDADGTAWIATAAGVAVRRPDGSVSTLAPPLASPDVRAVEPAPDGSVWFGTAAGVFVRTPTGGTSAITTANGLPSNDVRALALAADGPVWIATSAGIALKPVAGSVIALPTTSGLPSGDVRDVEIEGSGRIYAATANGLAVSAAGSMTFTIVAGLPSADVRAIAAGRHDTLWVATARGVARRSGGVWTSFGTGQGLATDDARTVSLASDGTAWAGTAAGVSTIAPDGTIANMDIVGGGGPTPAARSIHTGWSSPVDLTAAGDANREPCLAVDQNNRTWAIWSNLLPSSAPNETWVLKYRIFDPATGVWAPETQLTTPPVGSRSSDRSPSAVAITDGMRIYFSSDRNGGFGLWSVDVTLAGVATVPVSLTNDPSSDTAPVPVTVGGARWVLFRSDRNVPLAQIGPMRPSRSARVPDTGTLRRYAGSVTTAPPDLVRNETHKTFGDLLAYTPNRPDAAVALSEDELYTRGTVGLYVVRTRRGSALTLQEASRLRSLLSEFLPLNLRAVVIIVPPATEELVYRLGADIGESYMDDYPFVESLGPVTDQTQAAMPDVTIMKSNTAADVSADPANPVTLRKRTFFPPIQ